MHGFHVLLVTKGLPAISDQSTNTTSLQSQYNLVRSLAKTMSTT